LPTEKTGGGGVILILPVTKNWLQNYF